MSGLISRATFVIGAFFLSLGTAGYIYADGGQGGDKGNGGYTIYCKSRDNPEEFTLKTYDSAVMEHLPRFLGERSLFSIVEYSDNHEALNSIIKKFEGSLPLMGQDLRKFIRIYEAKGSFKDAIFWLPGDPADTEDKNLLSNLPNCNPMRIQTVVLDKRSVKTYLYKPELVNKLLLENDEFSWLLIHEWLWDYVNDSKAIIIINAYLHSSEFLNASEVEVYEHLTKFGILFAKGSVYSEVQKAETAMKEIFSEAEKLVVALNKALNKNTSGYRSRAKKKHDQKILNIYGALLEKVKELSQKEVGGIDENLINKRQALFKQLIELTERLKPK